ATRSAGDCCACIDAIKVTQRTNTANARLMPVRLALPVRLGRCDFIWYRNISHLSKGEALLIDDIKLRTQPEGEEVHEVRFRNLRENVNCSRLALSRRSGFWIRRLSLCSFPRLV